jgi:hypothetical protein
LWKQRAYVFYNISQQFSVIDLADKIVDEVNSWVAVCVLLFAKRSGFLVITLLSSIKIWYA